MRSGFAPLLGLLVIGTSAGRARADVTLVGSGQVALGGGHDNNALLQVVPAGAANGAARGWFARAAPSVAGALLWGDGHRLQLTYDADFRGSNDFGLLMFNSGELFYQTGRLGRVRLGAGFSGGAFAAGDYPDNGFAFASGQLSVQVELTERLQLTADASPEWRFGNDNSDPEVELIHWLDGRLTYQMGTRGSLGLWGTYLALGDADEGAFPSPLLQRTRGGLSAQVEFGQIGLWASGFAGSRMLGDETIPVAGGSGGVQYALGEHFSVAAVFEGNIDLQTATTGSGNRRQVALVLIANAGVRRSLGMKPERVRLAPLVRDTPSNNVRVRVRAPGAEAVRLVGSFDDWGQGHTAHRAEGSEDVWEVWMTLPPGAYQYRFLVDGQPVEAPEAARYAPDGFGGRNAVVDVQP